MVYLLLLIIALGKESLLIQFSNNTNTFCHFQVTNKLTNKYFFSKNVIHKNNLKKIYTNS